MSCKNCNHWHGRIRGLDGEKTIKLCNMHGILTNEEETCSWDTTGTKNELPKGNKSEKFV